MKKIKWVAFGITLLVLLTGCEKNPKESYRRPYSEQNARPNNET